MNPNLFVVVRPESNSPAPAQPSVYAGARKPNGYVEVAPLRKTDKPVGEWNKTEITCKGSMLTVINNGVETLKLNLDDLKILHGHHMQYKPVSQRPRKGFIGLQGDRGMQVEFRNILIKEL